MEVKTNPLSSRTNDAEMELIAKGSTLCGLTVSGFVRMSALEKARKLLKENSEESKNER